MMDGSILRTILEQIRSERNPLGIFKLVSLLPEPGSWNFVLMKTTEELKLTITPPTPVPLVHLLSLQVPEFLYSTTTELELKSDRLILPGAFSETVEPQGLPTTSDEVTRVKQITLKGFANSDLPAELLQENLLKRYLRDHTWLGSRKFQHRNVSVRVQVLGTTYEFRPKEIQQGVSTLRFKVECHVPAGEVMLATDVMQRRFSFRDSLLGTSELWTHTFESTVRELRKCGISGGVIEVDAADQVTLGLGGKEVAKPGASLEAIAKAAGQDAKLVALANVVSRHHHEGEVVDLNQRIERALHEPQVYVAGKRLTAVPRSEMCVVGLFHLIEGMDELPFKVFTSHAWAGASGLDLIADYQLTSTDPIKKGRPIEFELRLQNFFTHGHAIQQTDGVICWEDPSDSISGLSVTDLSWRYSYQSAEGDMWVAVVEKFPNLVVGVGGSAE